MKIVKYRGAMAQEFYLAFRELGGGDWLSFMGMPMVYDGALFVER